jgi:transposase
MTRKRTRATDLESLDQINVDAAGIDIGAAEIYVAVPKNRDTKSVRCFDTFTVDLKRIAEWLAACQITTVAMESTGVYWIPLFEILEAAGFEVYLVNARHLKNVPGRKTDVVDCQWLQELHTFGLLNASFIPDAAVRALRTLIRQREMLVQKRVAHIQHMQKALELMNIKLTEVLGKVTGVTGMTIIRAILAGEQDPKVLAGFRDPRCKHTVDEIEKALEGHYRHEHLFALRQAVELYDTYTEKIAECEIEIKATLEEMDPPDPDAEPTTKPPDRKSEKHRRDLALFQVAQELHRLSGVDLTQIDGISTMTAQVIISEIGLDVSKWPSAKHFASWLCLAPQNEITGGKIKRHGTAKTQNRAAAALRMAAQALSRSQSALGVYYRRQRGRLGPPKAITATANKLARIVYHMLKYREDYVDIGVAAQQAQARDRQLRYIKRQASRLGYTLTANPAVS